jgi:hypothetical protein
MTNVPPTKKPLTAPLYVRQDGEGDEAWDAFRTYRDMGLARTLDNARTKLGRPSGYGRVLESWSSEWSWVERCTAWDKHLDVKRRQAAEAKVVEMAERQARDAELLQDGLRPFIQALAEKSGRTPEELSSMSATALALLIKELGPAWKAGVETERKARGLEDVKVSVTGSVVVDGLRQAFNERRERRDVVQRAVIPSVVDEPSAPAQAS